MTIHEREPDGEPLQAAKRVLRAAFRVYVIVAVLAVLAVVASAFAPVRRVEDPKTKALIEGLLIVLFFAATIISLGIQWTANIVAARRYRHGNPYPAAVVVAVSQFTIMAMYAGVVAFVLYYRVRAGGELRALIPAIAALAAGVYFLRLPNYMIQGVYGRRKTDEKPEGGGGDSG